MTTKERDRLRRGLLYIMEDEGSRFGEGLAILAELAGWKYPAGRVKAGGVDPRKIAARPNTVFSVRGSP